MEKIDQNKVPKRKFYTGEEVPSALTNTARKRFPRPCTEQ